MSLWNWAVATYAKPGVSEACLDLQDGYQLNVCFLLWAMWAHPKSDALCAGVGMAREWENIVLKPLRGIRRRLPQSPLRDDVKAVELKAERSLLEALEGVTGEGAGDPLASLITACAMWGGSPPPEALQRLAGLVSGIETAR